MKQKQRPLGQKRNFSDLKGYQKLITGVVVAFVAIITLGIKYKGALAWMISKFDQETNQAPLDRTPEQRLNLPDDNPLNTLEQPEGYGYLNENEGESIEEFQDEQISNCLPLVDSTHEKK